MLEAELKHGNVLKKLIDAVKEFINEANFDCSSAGIKLQAMEGNHVTLVQFLLRSEGFETYRCDRNVCLGINIQSLAKILKCAGNDDAATLKADDNGDILNIAFSGVTNEKSSEFDLKLLSLNTQGFAIPETVYDATVTFSALEFQRICRDLSSLSETVAVSVAKDSVNFSAEGDIGKGSIYVKPAASADSEVRTTIQVLKPVSCSLSLKHMLMFTKATPLCDTVKICLSDEFPMMVEYSLEEMGHLRFYLAPKIDEE